MKKSKIELLILFIFLFFVLIYNSFINIILNNYGIYAFLLLFLFILLYINGYRKDRNRYNKDIMLTIAIYFFSFYLITYLLGIIIGFNHNVYSLKFINIIKNLFPVILMIILLEISRYIVIKRNDDDMLIIVFSTIIIILFYNTNLLNSINYKSFESILTNYSLYILPSIISNILLSYLTKKVSYKASILYQILYEVPFYIVPIIPAFGNYGWSILKCILPLVILLKLYLKFKKIDHELSIKSSYNKVNKIAMIFYIFILLFCFTYIGLSRGVFKYQMLVIISDSMNPTFYRGDAVIFKKIDSKMLSNVEEGEILVYNVDNKIVVHRLKSIIKIGDETFYKTKGDNNLSADNYLIDSKDIIGIEKRIIKFVGYPTLWLKETMQ